MRAMILAAGLGSRMRPLTYHTPKPLLPVKGQPLIVYHLQALAKANIKDIVINLGRLGHKIQAALGNGEAFGVQIQYSYEDPILETGGGIAKALPLLSPQFFADLKSNTKSKSIKLSPEPFIVVSGDVYTDYPFHRLPKEPSRLLHIVLVDNPPHHPKGDFALIDGLACERGGPLLNFAGISVYRPEFFKGCPKGAFPIIGLMREAIRAQQVTGEYYQGVWHNVGTPEQLEQLQIELQQEKQAQAE